MPFEQYPPEEPYAYDPAAMSAAARERVQLPAIFLLIVGILNLIAAPALVGIGFFYQSLPPEKMAQIMEQQDPAQWNELQRQGFTPQSLLAITARTLYTVGGMSGFCGLIGILGGVRMLQLRSYGLAVFASVLSMVPCISPSCCVALGGVAGIWALVVLLSNDVRSAFQ